MKIFLTGGTGFIGSHLLSALANLPHEVIALRRQGSSPCIELTCQPVWSEKPLDLLQVFDLVGVDAIVHLASVGVSPKKASWEDMFFWNVTVLVRLLEVAKAAGVPRVVVAGSFSEYGKSADQYDFIPVNAPLLPTNAYAASKAAAFIGAWSYAIENKIELCYLRIFSAYGEGQYVGNFWPALRAAAQSGLDFPMTLGQQVRDYVPVADVVKQIVNAVLRDDINAGCPLVMNVGSGKPVTMRDFAEYWWTHWQAQGRLLPGAIDYRPNEPMRFVPVVESFS